MSAISGKGTVAIVTACMRKDGTPAFALNEVSVTQEEAANGIHYYLAEAQLLEDGYEEPFVHFDETEAPEFLHAAVRDHLALSPAVTGQNLAALSEGR
jgi:hypothetical protein